MSDRKFSSPTGLTDRQTPAVQEEQNSTLAEPAVSIDLGQSTNEFSKSNTGEAAEQPGTELQLKQVTTVPSLAEAPGSTPPTSHESPGSLKFSTSHVSSDFMDMDDVRNSVKELLIPVMMSGLGNLGAGVILSKMISLPVFRAIPWLIALVPALLGLKGNVEMTLSSRLTTQAHLGHLDDKEMRRKILVGNIALAQAQASGVGIIAPIIAILISFFQTNIEVIQDEKDEITTPKSLLSISAAVATSGIADIVLASTMSMVIILAHLYCRVDVDNIATPIAASLGDVVTMALFSGIAVGMFNFYQDPKLHWLLAVPLIFYIGVCAYSSFLARRNPHVSKQIIYGWNPLLVSMLIQNLSGMVMEKFSRDFPRMTVFQPIINGFGGNLVAIQCSRIATHLQKSGSKKELLSENEPCCSFPWLFFFGKGRHGKLASVLVLIAGPLQIPFVIAALLLSDLPVATPLLFIFYYVAATLQVIVILYVGYCFINILWLVGINPDNSSIPILTALADLLGCILMAVTSLFLELFDDPNSLPYRNEHHIIIASNSTIY